VVVGDAPRHQAYAHFRVALRRLQLPRLAKPDVKSISCVLKKLARDSTSAATAADTGLATAVF
jgi:hypothetical protein